MQTFDSDFGNSKDNNKMQDVIEMVRRLKRPKLLAQTARISSGTFKREIWLPRLLMRENCPRIGDAILQLLNLEGAENEMRVQNDPAYSFEKHLNLLTAIIAETAQLQLSRGDEIR